MICLQKLGVHLLWLYRLVTGNKVEGGFGSPLTVSESSAAKTANSSPVIRSDTASSWSIAAGLPEGMEANLFFKAAARPSIAAVASLHGACYIHAAFYERARLPEIEPGSPKYQA